MTESVESQISRRLLEVIGIAGERWHFADGRFHVQEFRDQPRRGVVTFATLGLSEFVLHQEAGPVRQELLFSCEGRFEDLPIPDGLACLAGDRALAGRPFLDGEIVGPVGWLGRKVRVDSFLVSSPRFFPDALGAPIPTDPVTGFVWIVPLTPEEAEIGQTHGPDALDQMFAAHQPDLFDLGRRGLSAKHLVG